MLPLSACAGRPDVGGKAETLARARAAGLTVLDGVVVLPAEAVDPVQLAGELARLGGERFAVRSSSLIEDRVGASAAGVFVSVIGVARSDVPAAIEQVRKSADAPPAAAYLQAHGIARTDAAMAVLIQPLVAAECLGVAHSRAGEFLVEERAPLQPEWGDVRPRMVARDDAGALASELRVLERLVGGPVDAEFARAGDEVTFLQARRLSIGGTIEPSGSWAGLEVEDGRWRLDAEHNPDPLSRAQAGLVAFVERLGVGPRQRVIGGYLFFEVDAPSRGLAPIPLAQLRQKFREDVLADCERALATAGSEGSLDAALDAYAHVFRRYVGEVAPTLAKARQQLDQFLRSNLGETLSMHGPLLAGLGGLTLERDQLLWELGRAPTEAKLAVLLERFGDYAPAWDVAAATDREHPERVRARAAAAATGQSPNERHAAALAQSDAAASALLERFDRMARRAFKALLPAVREVLPIAEDDDWLFYRAQATIRRALLSFAPALRLEAPQAIFDLPLETLLAPAEEVDWRALAKSGQQERERAGRHLPPARIEQRKPLWPLPRSRDVLRGQGTAGHGRGRAVVVRSLGEPPTTLPDRAVLVVPAIVPALTPLLINVGGLVTAHGGATSHGATLAREYGIPAVLGVSNATSLPDGVELYLDGDAGRVYVLA